jgi:hypothetical protein
LALDRLDDHVSDRRPPGERRRPDTFRIVVWAALAAPLVIYVLVVPVRARLDRGVIERHRSSSIWTTMADELPQVAAQSLLVAAFWLGLALFMAGVLVLLWLALAGVDQGAPPETAADSWEPASADDPRAAAGSQ